MIYERTLWYQYFKKHLKEIDTWIDFENQIQKILEYFGSYLEYVRDSNNVKKMLDIQKIQQELGLFKLFNRQIEYIKLSKGVDNGSETSKKSRIILNSKFCYKENIQNGLNHSCFLEFLQNQLNDLIEIFNLYLNLVIDQLNPNFEFTIEVLEERLPLFKSKEPVNKWKKPSSIYSFNYTNSYQKFYDDEVDIEFLHGKLGEKQNIVLGIDDLESDELKKLKAYGFTKYHQKLFKETDYLFLNSYKNKVEVHKKKIECFEKDFVGSSEDRGFYRKQIMERESKLDLTFYIWGHSLDVSDKDYIIDLFSLNDDLDRNVRVVVYYFDQNAKFSLLNNLLSILEKNKVEHWMKNRWLKFEENPEIDFGI